MVKHDTEYHRKRFWRFAIIGKKNECWLWKGATRSGEVSKKGLFGKGYGRYSYKGKLWLAHRLSYLFTNGPIPTGIFVCHKCDNPSCVNPYHLFLGTAKDNAVDCMNKGRTGNRKKTHCKRGHPFDATNTYYSKDGRRYCKACSRAHQAMSRTRHSRAHLHI